MIILKTTKKSGLFPLSRKSDFGKNKGGQIDPQHFYD